MKKTSKLFVTSLIFLMCTLFLSGCTDNVNNESGSDSGMESSENNIETDVGEFIFEADENTKTITITGHKNPIGRITIPETIGEYIVIAIDEFAFFETELTEIYFPKTLKSIGYASFYGCTKLESVFFSDDTFELTSINGFTFAKCASLKNITVPESVSLIDDFAFMDCVDASNVNILNSNATIKNSAFAGCANAPVEYDGDLCDVSINRLSVSVFSGYDYSEWTTVSTFESDTPVELTADDTTRTMSNGYYVKTDEDLNSQVIYKYIVQEREKTEKTTESMITTYNYNVLVNIDGKVVKEEYFNQSELPLD